MLQFEVHVVAAVAVSFHQAVVIGVCSTQREFCLLRTTADTHVVAHGEIVVAEHLILPIVACLILVEVKVIISTIALFEGTDTRVALHGLTLIEEHHVLIGIHRVEFLADGLALDVHVVTHLSLTTLGTLCCNQDNTVCTLRTVDGC